MNHDWPKMTGDLSQAIRELRTGAPEPMKAFSALAKAATANDTVGADPRRMRRKQTIRLIHGHGHGI